MRTSKLSRACLYRQRKEASGKRYDRIEELWNQGLTAREIAEEMRSTPRSIRRTIRIMRERGYSLPRRRRSDAQWGPGRSPTSSPSKVQARWRLASALAYGLIDRADRCTRCGAASDLIEAHHHDYAKPLEVEWLCASCHQVEHGREPVVVDTQ